MAIEDRVQLIKETGWRQAAPAFVPQRLMSGAATSATNILRAGGIGKQSWYPVAQLNPRCGRLRHGAVLASHMQDFCPEPFAGINTANIAGVVNIARRVAQTGNLFRFFNRSVVFPQYEHRVRVFGKLRAQRQHVTVGINRCGRRAGCVNANPDHSCALLGAKLCKHGFQRRFH